MCVYFALSIYLLLLSYYRHPFIHKYLYYTHHNMCDLICLFPQIIIKRYACIYTYVQRVCTTYINYCENMYSIVNNSKAYNSCRRVNVIETNVNIHTKTYFGILVRLRCKLNNVYYGLIVLTYIRPLSIVVLLVM